MQNDSNTQSNRVSIFKEEEGEKDILMLYQAYVFINIDLYFNMESECFPTELSQSLAYVFEVKIWRLDVEIIFLYKSKRFSQLDEELFSLSGF